MPDSARTERDGTALMWFDEAGNAIDGADWTSARARVASFLMADTSNEAWAYDRAERILGVIFEANHA